MNAQSQKEKGICKLQTVYLRYLVVVTLGGQLEQQKTAISVGYVNRSIIILWSKSKEPSSKKARIMPGHIPHGVLICSMKWSRKAENQRCMSARVPDPRLHLYGLRNGEYSPESLRMSCYVRRAESTKLSYGGTYMISGAKPESKTSVCKQ